MYIRQCHMFIIHNQFFKKIFRRKRRIFELLMSFSSQTLFIMSTVRKVRLNKLLVYRSEIFVGQIQQTPWPHHHHVVHKRKKVKMKMVSKKCFWNKTFLLCTNFLFCVFTKFSNKNVMFMFEKFLWEFWGWMTLFRKVISNNYSLNICKNRNMLINDINSFE